MDKKAGRKLIAWYEREKRDLPWRETKDPYLIWVSEIILQQTRVDQGLPYYLKFVSAFPNIKSLAKATEEEVLKHWQGLGYYSRARNMHTTARMICETQKGIFPSNHEDILKLKGIGPYTAAAIASISFSAPYSVVDGNVSRVVSRLFGIDEAVNSTIGLKIINENLKTIFIEDDPGNFNQAIMELGAMVCKPISPDCNDCILKENCYALANDKIELLPVKTKLKKPKQIYLYYFVIKQSLKNEKILYLNQRKSNAIWKNMYDFPGIETEKKIEINDLITDFKKKFNLSNIDNGSLKISGPVKHQLTHRSIKAYFIEINVGADFEYKNHKNLISLNLTELYKYPVPKLIENHLKKYDLSNDF